MGLSLTSLTGFLIAFAFMLLIGLAFTAFGIAIASKMEDMQGFQLVINFVIFPIFGLSGALFPIKSLPGWVQTVTLIDPLTYGVDGLRYGLLGAQAATMDPLVSFGVLALFTVAMIAFGGYLFRKIKI